MTRRGVVFLMSAALWLGAGVAGAQDEKLLLGFEENEKGLPQNGGPKTEGYLKYGLRQGNATEGKSAMGLDFRKTGAPKPDAWKERLNRYCPGMMEKYAAISPELARYMEFVLGWTYDRLNFAERNQSLLYTLGWFDKAMPKDWSAFDLLRVDAMSTAADVADLRAGVEDEFVEPFVYRTYAFPAGKWVTLEFDLREAAKDRHLDLAHMVNMHVWAKSFAGTDAKPTSLLIDNVRLSKGGKGKTQATVVKGASWGPPAIPVVKVDRSRKGPPPDNSPIKVEPPLAIDAAVLGLKKDPIRAGGGTFLTACGRISAYDNNRMLALFEGGGELMQALRTTDGGKTWTGLDGASKVSLARSTATAFGGGKAEAGGFTYIGCGHFVLGTYCQGDYSGPRHFSTQITFDGERWTQQPYGFIGDISRHCYGNGAAVTLASGRMWCAIVSHGRHEQVSRELHVKYSDDGGLTWRSWRGEGLSGRIESADGADKAMGQIHLTPFGEQVACFFKMTNGKNTLWTYYDGKAWSKAEQVTGGGTPLGATTIHGREIYLSTTDGVYKYNGTAWAKESGVPGGGFVCAAGKDKVLLFGTWQAGQIAYRMNKGDGWSQPKVVAEEPGYQAGSKSFGVPQYAPPNFVPILWPSGNTLKILRVPVE